jgi:hypothetical protein
MGEIVVARESLSESKGLGVELEGDLGVDPGVEVLSRQFDVEKRRRRFLKHMIPVRRGHNP